MTTTPKVYAAIAAVMADLSAEGIAKTGKNSQQGYAFRGIDQVYNTLSSVLSKHGLLMLPKALSRECVERQTKSGGALFYSTVHMEFTLVAAEDGSQHIIQTYGEAMDSADKSTNKAMSAAYKYAAMQAFCIPTEGDNDADGTTHEVAPVGRSPAKVEAAKAGIVSLTTMEAHAAWPKVNAAMLEDMQADDHNDVVAMWKARAATIKAMEATQ